jgi:tetratricopeptide (TPR) repeat protein
LKYKKLNLYTATLLNNYIIHHVKRIDSIFVNEAYRIASDPDNSSFSEALKASLAYGFYHQGNISRAMDVLAEQVFLSQSYQGKFNYIMGLWALEQGNPERASTFFTFADTYDFKDARFYNAIALTEAGQVKPAINAWDTVLVHGDDAQKEIAMRIRRILTLSPSEADGLTDAEKYQFCRYRVGTSDSVFFNRLSQGFDDTNYLAQALLDMARKYFEGGQVASAIRYYRQIGGLRLTDRRLYNETRHFELKMLASRGEVYQLAQQINDGIEFPPDRILEKVFYTALISEANGDMQAAEKNYRILATYNPYFEEAVIAAYQFFRKTEDKNLYPYTILAEAIQVNPTSLPLLYAYREEAMRAGLDEYAVNVSERIREIEARRD